MSSNSSNATPNRSNANNSQNNTQAINEGTTTHASRNSILRDAEEVVPVAIYPDQLEEGPTESPNAHVNALRGGPENGDSTSK
jgi:hypothetical protein